MHQGIGDATLSRPLILGHEFSGLIADGGRRGQRVAVEPAIPCNRCPQCLQGHPNLCPYHRFAGHDRMDGALQSEVAWPQRCLFPIPDAISDAEGALLEPLGVALHAVDLGKLKTGITVGIFGCGPIGLLVLQVALRSGATTLLATDKLEHRCRAAVDFGADHVVNATREAVVRAVLDKTQGQGVDVAFEAAGDNDAVENAIDCAKPGGRVVLIGIPPDNRTAFDAATARRKGLTLKLVRRMKHTYPRAIELVRNGHINLLSLISHRYALSDFREAFDVARKRQGMKVVINPNG
jgi:L-iditol 2-dehydrogenase